MTFLKHIFIIILLTSFLTGCQNQKKDEEPDPQTMELAQARAAFQAGEYHKAVRLLLPLAQQGNPDAQYALGYALYEGLGVPQDRMQAYFWIQESALQGNQSALLALEIFEIDPTLPIDGQPEIERHLGGHNIPTTHSPTPLHHQSTGYENQYEEEFASRQITDDSEEFTDK